MKCFEFLADPDDAVELEPIIVARVKTDAGELSTADPWRSSLQYRTEARHGHNSRRRLRSRSSPVRNTGDKNERRERARSPSACSPRRRARDRSPQRHTQPSGAFMPSEYPLDSPMHSEDFLQIPNSYWCGSSSTCGSAYFSQCPPAYPLRLVPIVTPTRPPMAPSGYSNVTGIARVSCTKREYEDRDGTVSSLLRELVGSLPLQTLNRKPTACISSVAHNLESENVDPLIPSRSCLKIRHSSMSTYSHGDRDRVQRSIATQAKSNPDHEAVHGHKQGSEAALPDEWLGGVRALRDSHVRLVLRQLRHINRLNRTLDRAVRSPPPPPPSSPRATAPATAPVAMSTNAQV